MNKRTCTFCGFTATYDEFPDDSICFAGICVCGNCLEKVEGAELREFLQIESKELVNAN